RRPRRAVRSKPRSSSTRKRRRYKRHAPTEARDRALAALKANPAATPTEIAKIAKVSRSTAVIARKELAKEARKAARKGARETSNPACAPPACAALPPGATRTWPQAGERRRGGGRQGPHR